MLNEGWKRAIRRLHKRRKNTVDVLALQFDVTVAEILEIVKDCDKRPARILSAADERSMRRLHEGVPVSVTDLARLFGVSRTKAHTVLSGHGDRELGRQETAKVRE